VIESFTGAGPGCSPERGILFSAGKFFYVDKPRAVTEIHITTMSTPKKTKKTALKPTRPKLKLPPDTVLLAQPKNPKNDFCCVRCSHEWEARKQGGLPTRCPACYSAAWNKPYARANGPRYHCQHCKHNWHAVKTDGPPAICPKCRSYDWNNRAILPSAKPPGMK
jgi:DNA-directed RNA polymerase subunit RPC12/RpoP